MTEASAAQTGKVSDLTDKLRTLTLVITVLTVFATLFGAIQAAAVLVHLYRWYRGWL